MICETLSHKEQVENTLSYDITQKPPFPEHCLEYSGNKQMFAVAT